MRINQRTGKILNLISAITWKIGAGILFECQYSCRNDNVYGIFNFL
jgi:hypothetical protein